MQKSLENLATQGKIKEKLYGKQKVYAPLQVWKKSWTEPGNSERGNQDEIAL